MQRSQSKTSHGVTGRVVMVGALALAGSVASTGNVLAQGKQGAVPDAQVESSVLQALAANPTLAGQQISSTSVYGVVTLTGHVSDEATRSLAEDVVSRTAGVTKVVDELTLGAPAAAASAPQQGGDGAGVGQGGSNPTLQSDGTFAPATATDGTGAAIQPENQPAAQSAPLERNQPQATPGDQGQSGYGQDQGMAGAGGYGQPANQEPRYGSDQPGYGQPQSPPYNGGYYGPPQGYAGGSSSGYGQRGGVAEQQGGVRLTVPAGAPIELLISQGIDSKHAQVGGTFTGVVLYNVMYGGHVAIPRGASLQGTIVDASSSGTLKGRAELGLQLNQLMMGGVVYPISTTPWSREGSDKTARTVNSALGLGVLGAIVGGIAGGGAGAAIGAGAGGAAGLGASAASGSGVVFVPPESVLTFRLAAPLEINTLSQAEVVRLSYNVPGGPYQGQRMMRRYPGYYYYPYAPGYYGPRPGPGYPY